MVGVTKGFAGIKLSGSPRKYGFRRVSRIKNIIRNPTMSLNVTIDEMGFCLQEKTPPGGCYHQSGE